MNEIFRKILIYSMLSALLFFTDLTVLHITDITDLIY